MYTVSCTECGIDVQSLRNRGRLCASCKKNKTATRRAAWYRKTRRKQRFPYCVDCGDDISELRTDTIRCRPCTKTRRNRYCITYHRENRERLQEYRMQYRKQPHIRERRRVHNLVRRRRLKNTDNTALSETWIDRLLVVQDYTCPDCLELFTDELQPTLDHILPLSRGGLHTYDNTQLLCQSCNSRKKDKHPEVYYGANWTHRIADAA